MAMRRMRHLTLTLLVVLAAGCTGPGDGGDQPLRVGTSLPLSGERAQLGLDTRRGYELWRDMVNGDGGLLGRPVELVVRDNGSNEETVAADYQHLIGHDKPELLLGSQSSVLNLPASAVAERGKMLFVCPSCGSKDMFSRGFHYLFFAQPATGVHQADLFAQWVASLPPDQRPRTAAYPFLDNPFHTSVVESIKRQLELIGIKTVHHAVYPEDASNSATVFDAIARRIKSTGADMVAHGASFEDGVAMINSFIKVGYSPKVLFQTTAPAEGDEFVAAIGRQNTNGVFFAVSWSPDANYPLNRDFVRAYASRFDGAPSEDAADAFAAAQIVQAAVEGVGSLDQAKLADWLHDNTVQTILGPMSWDQRGAPEGSFILGQWQRGSSRIVLPRNVANTDTIVFPKPDWAPADY
jgi:branched-chain amino acid transport system substrate-binding protein